MLGITQKYKLRTLSLKALWFLGHTFHSPWIPEKTGVQGAWGCGRCRKRRKLCSYLSKWRALHGACYLFLLINWLFSFTIFFFFCVTNTFLYQQIAQRQTGKQGINLWLISVLDMVQWVASSSWSSDRTKALTAAPKTNAVFWSLLCLWASMFQTSQTASLILWSVDRNAGAKCCWWLWVLG